MKLLDVIREGSCITLITDEGELKNSWSRNHGIEQKARLLIGKNIKHETWGGYDSTKWFSNIIEVVDAENIDFPSAPDASASNIGVSDVVGLDDEESPSNSNFTYGVIYESQTRQRLIGPPGTGKTTELIRLVKEQIASGVESKDIAFIAFTNVAADEAIARVQQAFEGQDHDFANFSTLHSLATRCGGSLGKRLVGPEEFRMFDPSISLVEEWIKVGDAASAVFRPKHPVLDAESLRINTESESLDFSKVNRNALVSSLEKFFSKQITGPKEIESKVISYLACYKKFKEDNNLADFNDVVLNVASSAFPQDKIPCFSLLIVDEAQDLSALQWRFVWRLAQNAKKTIVAGDDDQAIMESFGASPKDFISFPTTENDFLLKQSHRLPIKMKEWLDQTVLKSLVNANPDRLEKTWFGRKGSGLDGAIISSEIVEKEIQGEKKKIKSSIDLDRLLRIVQVRQNEEWLIMAPTKATCEQISNGLSSLRVPHFHLRRDVISNSNQIYVQTIHSSKGMDVENAALVIASRGDKFMLDNDARLTYVAVTRAKSELYPRVSGK